MDAEVTGRNRELERESRADQGGQQGDAPTPARQPAAPYGREPTGRGAAAGRLPPHPQAAGTRSNAPPVTAPARPDRPPSPRRAFCRRAKITVKGAPKGASPAAMAQAPPQTLIFHGKIRRQSEGRTELDSAALDSHLSWTRAVRLGTLDEWRLTLTCWGRLEPRRLG